MTRRYPLWHGAACDDSTAVPKLVLLNGPPGVGKSTVARRYADARPMTLALEIDSIRAMIGSWLEVAGRSGLAARRIAVQAAATHLESGYDVIVPQLLTRREFVEELQSTAETVGATFLEITLVDAKAAVVDRAARRVDPADGFSARALAAQQGHSLEDSYDRFMDALAQRPEAVVIEASSIRDACEQLAAALEQA